MCRREALGEEVMRWTAIVKEAADRQLVKVVDSSSKEGGGEGVGQRSAGVERK
jgi:hypothetical protein